MPDNEQLVAIKAAKVAALVTQAKANALQAKAASQSAEVDTLIVEAVAELGGLPGIDRLCLDCGAIVKPDTEHSCAQ